MTWIARQPFRMIVIMAAAWIVLFPEVIRLLFHAALWVAARYGSVIAVSVEVRWPARAAALLLPPLALIVAWWVARRGRTR